MCEIRSVAESDLDEIAAIEKLSNPNPWTKKMFEAEVANPNAVNLLVNGGSGRILSYIFSWLYADELEIQNIATHPDFRRKGHAACLVGEVIRKASGTGVKRAYLEVRAGNSNAIALYNKFGFSVKYIRKKYYQNQENAVQMELVTG